MTTLKPRPPYTKEELALLYPDGLQLELVQVLMRHGERSPVSTRFQNAGLAPFWPYCSAARRLSSITLLDHKSQRWDKLEWRRRLETFGHDDSPVAATGPQAEVDSICNLGELTDKGRETTLQLGRRLRHLYVDQLGFMPNLISDPDIFYLRATPIPRALESLQQSFWGMYPPSKRTADFPASTIISRTPADETLFPNDGNCRRFSQLSRAFAQRTADRWNSTTEMDYLNKLIGKWMPPGSRVAVDSHPRLSGIMDTINSTLAHGEPTRLPKEFYDLKGRQIIDRIGVEEWFSGFKESREYRSLGIGSLLGDVVHRMVGHVDGSSQDGILEVGGEDGNSGFGRGGQTNIKFALSGCHDTTLAAIMASLGAFEGDVYKWPPYTSHIAMEMFRKPGADDTTTPSGSSVGTARGPPNHSTAQQKGLWSALFGGLTGATSSQPALSRGIGRKLTEDLAEHEKARLDGYYVRLRFNDQPLIVEGCKAPGKHWEGDESFCTLTAFKEIVDKFTPRNWKQACASNLDAPPFPASPEPSGI